MAKQPAAVPTASPGRPAPKTVSRSLTYACGHTERSRAQYPPALRATNPEARSQWAGREFAYRARGTCSLCYATGLLSGLSDREAALHADYGITLPTFPNASLPLAVRARTLRLQVIDGALTELAAPEYGQHMLAQVLLAALLAATSGAPDRTPDDRLAVARRLHARHLLHDLAQRTDPRFWLLRTAQGARAYALGATLARDLRHLLAAFAVSSHPVESAHTEHAAFVQMLDKCRPEDRDLLATGFAEGLALADVLQRRAVLAALTRPLPATSAPGPW